MPLLWSRHASVPSYTKTDWLQTLRTSSQEGSTTILVASPSLASDAVNSTTSPLPYQPLSGASIIVAFRLRLSASANALGAMIASSPARTKASIRSLPMVYHGRHPLEVMRFMPLVSEDGRLHSRD